jgi:hypothetical protein
MEQEKPPPETSFLGELKRQGDCLVVLTEEVIQCRINIARLEVKSGVWGFLGGLIPALCLLIYYIVKQSK